MQPLQVTDEARKVVFFIFAALWMRPQLVEIRLPMLEIHPHTIWTR